MRYTARILALMLLLIFLAVPAVLAAESAETQVDIYDENQELNQSIVFIVGRSQLPTT